MNASVLTGPREEWVASGIKAPTWVRPDNDLLYLADGRTVRDADAVYLPPCDPTKIICIHLNYESRRVEFKAPKLVTPTYFQKPLTTLNTHRGYLNRPANCKYLNYEGEIAAIVGKPMRNVAREEVWAHLAGFAPANDVGAQDFRDIDAGSMLRVKGQDGFCPVGPGIVRGIDIREQTVRTKRACFVRAHQCPIRNPYLNTALEAAIPKQEEAPMSRLYGPQHRELQDHFSSRTMADRIELIANKRSRYKRLS